MFLTPIIVQDSYLTGFLITLPLLVVIAETAGSLVQTPEAGTESMTPDLADRTLSGSGWMTEELVAASETGFLFGAPEASSLVDTLEAGFLVVASETETLPLGTTPFCAVTVTGWLKTPQMALLGKVHCVPEMSLIPPVCTAILCSSLI